MFDANWELIRWKKGKSDKKYSYTLADIARLRGVSVGHVRNLVSQGKLRPESLEDVVVYLYSKKGKVSPNVHPDDVYVVFGKTIHSIGGVSKECSQNRTRDLKEKL